MTAERGLVLEGAGGRVRYVFHGFRSRLRKRDRFVVWVLLQNQYFLIQV